MKIKYNISAKIKFIFSMITKWTIFKLMLVNYVNVMIYYLFLL